MNTTLTPISQIKPNPNNPRTIKDVKYKKLVESIRTFPKMLELRPIVVNDDMIVLGGNMRLKACKEAGIKEVPVIKASDLTEEEQRQFIIKDNVGYGEWDWEMLANEWDVAELDEWGMDLPKDMFEKDVNVDEDEVPEPPVDPITKPGDLWILGEHRLLCGDSTKQEDIDRLLGGQKVGAVVTDPPYGMNFQSNFRKQKHDAISGDNDEVLLIHAINTQSMHSKYIWCRWDNIPKNPKPKSVITWIKNNWSMGDLEHEHARQTEVCLFYDGPAHKWPDKRPTDVLSHKRTNNELHPTQKPVELMAEIVNMTEGLIYDLFCGSGSTLIACEQLRRKCYGMEISPQYCDVIVKRWENITGKRAELEKCEA